MYEIFKFILTNFWHFIGTIILIMILVDGIVEIIKTIKNK